MDWNLKSFFFDRSDISTHGSDLQSAFVSKTCPSTFLAFVSFIRFRGRQGLTSITNPQPLPCYGFKRGAARFGQNPVLFHAIISIGLNFKLDFVFKRRSPGEVKSPTIGGASQEIKALLQYYYYRNTSPHPPLADAGGNLGGFSCAFCV